MPDDSKAKATLKKLIGTNEYASDADFAELESALQNYRSLVRGGNLREPISGESTGSANSSQIPVLIERPVCGRRDQSPLTW